MVPNPVKYCILFLWHLYVSARPAYALLCAVLYSCTMNLFLRYLRHLSDASTETMLLMYEVRQMKFAIKKHLGVKLPWAKYSDTWCDDEPLRLFIFFSFSVIMIASVSSIKRTYDGVTVGSGIYDRSQYLQLHNSIRLRSNDSVLEIISAYYHHTTWYGLLSKLYSNIAGENQLVFKLKTF